MTTKTLRFLTVSQVQRLHAVFIVPNAVPTQPSVLESAIHSPMNLKYYAKEEDVFQLAANLAERIMKKLANAHVAVVTNQWTAERWEIITSSYQRLLVR
ncbi:unnamed protein product [Penicillium salamii]|nr:unnamed protein product [Penicillium salamii]CAG8278683.1 unnamed protein product [Penicillium salamii]